MNALYNHRAEESVLGACLLTSGAWDTVQELLVAEDFHDARHRDIFRALEQLSREGFPMDVVTVSSALNRSGEPNGETLLLVAELARYVPGASNAGAYARLVLDCALRRRLAECANDIAALASDPEIGRAEAIESAERKVLAVASQRQKGGAWASFKNVMDETVDKIETAFQCDGCITGQSTGLVDLDEATSGLQPSDLIIAAGRPSMGKTAFAMGIAKHVALSGKPAAVFSMEMPKLQLGQRAVASVGQIKLSAIRTGRLAEDDIPRFSAAVTKLAEANLFVDDSPGLTPSDLRARCRRLAQEHGQLALVVVDYLQLMRVPGMEKNRVQEVSEISRSLKALAKEFNVPVIALSQLSRNPEQRPNKRPTMADLRESGAIEQDADLIMSIYRDEVYNPDTSDKGIAEVGILKQRNGPLTTVRVSFQGEYARFKNLSSDQHGLEWE